MANPVGQKGGSDGPYRRIRWPACARPAAAWARQWHRAGARAGADRLGAVASRFLLALQAAADPKVVDGRYELRVGADVFTVDGTSGSVRVRRGTADRPEAALTADAGTLRAVALGKRRIADAVDSGDLRLEGDPQAIAGLASLLQALTSAP